MQLHVKVEQEALVAADYALEVVGNIVEKRAFAIRRKQCAPVLMAPVAVFRNCHVAQGCGGKIIGFFDGNHQLLHAAGAADAAMVVCPQPGERRLCRVNHRLPCGKHGGIILHTAHIGTAKGCALVKMTDVVSQNLRTLSFLTKCVHQ